MKKSRKLLVLMLTAVFTVAALMGCSKKGKETETDKTGKVAEGTQNSETKTELKGKLELFSSKSENAGILQELIDKFTAANPGVTITLNSPSDAGTVLKTRLTKNDIPDIIAMGGDATYTELQSAGVLADLSNEPYIGNIQESYLQMLYDVNKDKEQAAYGIPFATNASGVLYNVDMFKEVGITVPTTWDEFMDVIGKLEAAGKQPFELTFKDNWTCLPPWNSMAPDLMDANFTTDRMENKTTFADTHSEVLEKYLEILKHAPNDIMGTTYGDGNKMFAEGGAAMMINGNWAIPEFKKINPNFNVDLFAFPASNDTSKNYVTSGVDVLFAVSAQSKQQEAAKAFVAFMVEQENAQAYVDNQFAFSAVKGVEQNDPTVAGVKADIASGKVTNFPDHYYPSGFDLASILSEFALNYTSGMGNQENITKTLKLIDEQYNAVNVN